VGEHPELREHLSAMTAYLRMRLRGIGLDIIDSPAPIVSFALATGAEMQALQSRLLDRGIHIYYSTYMGAGPEGMIRCAVFRDHTREDMDALVGALKSS
jgi:8-amino-7-oxononanoate synthase